MKFNKYSETVDVEKNNKFGIRIPEKPKSLEIKSNHL